MEIDTVVSERNPATLIYLSGPKSFLAFAVRDEDGDVMGTQDVTLAWTGSYQLAREMVAAERLGKYDVQYLAVEAVLRNLDNGRRWRWLR